VSTIGIEHGQVHRVLQSTLHLLTLNRFDTWAMWASTLRNLFADRTARKSGTTHHLEMRVVKPRSPLGTTRSINGQAEWRTRETARLRTPAAAGCEENLHSSRLASRRLKEAADLNPEPAEHPCYAVKFGECGPREAGCAGLEWGR
jgi:hypothetical protein